MSIGHTINISRSMPILSRIFPFKLRYLGFTPQFSTRSFRPRQPGPRLEFSRRGSGGGGRERGEAVRASKCLIDDEAELSDWVGELRSNSFRGRISSEDELDSGMGHGNRSKSGGGRDRGDRGGYKGGDRERSSMKRGRERHSDDFGESNRRTRGKFESSRRNSSRVGKRFGGAGEEEERDEKWAKRYDSWTTSHTNAGLMNERRGGRERDFGFKIDGKGVRGKRAFVDDEEEEEEDEKKGLMGNLGGLISEEESDDDDANVGDDGLFEINAQSSMGLERESSVKDRPSSPGKSDSYLSETRCAKGMT